VKLDRQVNCQIPTNARPNGKRGFTLLVHSISNFLQLSSFFLSQTFKFLPFHPQSLPFLVAYKFHGQNTTIQLYFLAISEPPEISSVNKPRGLRGESLPTERGTKLVSEPQHHSLVYLPINNSPSFSNQSTFLSIHQPYKS
jgi:hypothetical protein